jgi:hypothetical protein
MLLFLIEKVICRFEGVAWLNKGSGFLGFEKEALNDIRRKN